MLSADDPTVVLLAGTIDDLAVFTVGDLKQLAEALGLGDRGKLTTKPKLVKAIGAAVAAASDGT